MPVTDEVIKTAERSDRDTETQTIVIQESKGPDTVGWTNIAISAIMTLWTIFAQRNHVVALARWIHRQGRRGARASGRLIRLLRSRS